MYLSRLFNEYIYLDYSKYRHKNAFIIIKIMKNMLNIYICSEGFFNFDLSNKMDNFCLKRLIEKSVSNCNDRWKNKLGLFCCCANYVICYMKMTHINMVQNRGYISKWKLDLFSQ